MLRAVALVLGARGVSVLTFAMELSICRVTFPSVLPRRVSLPPLYSVLQPNLCNYTINTKPKTNQATNRNEMMG